MGSRALAVVVVTGCHVVTQTETVTPSALERVRHAEAPQPAAPALVLSEACQLRLVETLECPTEEVVTTTSTAEVTIGPNLATFVVGTIATAAGW